MSFLPHSSRGRHAVDEQPADGKPASDKERLDDEEPNGGPAPERPRYAFGYAPDDATEDGATAGNVVRGDVVREDEDGDYPPVTVADVPASADPVTAAPVFTPAAPATPATQAPAAPTVESPVMAADQGADPAGTPVPAPRPATEHEPAAPATAAQGATTEAELGEPLLVDAAELRARWQRAQSDFVDDPRAAVTDAAALVEQTAQAMIDALEQRQRVLRQQWERGQAGDPNAPAGEPSDTERLRLTMQHYRVLFDQLCAR